MGDAVMNSMAVGSVAVPCPVSLVSGPLYPRRCPCRYQLQFQVSQRWSHFATLPIPSVSDDMSINTVPADVLLEIADHLARPAEVLHLYLSVCNYSVITWPSLAQIFSA